MVKQDTQAKKEAKQVTLYVEVKHIKLDNGNEFDAFKTPVGKLNLDVKFNKDAEKPVKSGYYTFLTSEINLNTQGDYPVLWIRK